MFTEEKPLTISALPDLMLNVMNSGYQGILKWFPWLVFTTPELIIRFTHLQQQDRYMECDIEKVINKRTKRRSTPSTRHYALERHHNTFNHKKIDRQTPPWLHQSTSSSITTGTTSELFICFTSGLSSSSMKSILSPGRAREPSQISLSASLSRRLKTNGSIKSGQSPMFPKKRGAGFENVEPSSPKVTCIGQVRMKTKKQGKKMRTRSKRREGGGGGNVSFRRVDQNKIPNQDYTTSTTNHVNPECLRHRNQRWVHLPVTICEGLRAFGAELNCFTPCRSNCMKEKEEEGSGRSSRGALFSRWLMAVQEGEGKGREIKLVVGEQERIEKSSSSNAEMMMMRSQRRHVFEEIEFKEEMFEGKNMKSEEEEEGRVSICIPPKNALLLMRCRSDPVKIAALANKFWEPPEVKEEEKEEEDVKEAEQEKAGEVGKLNLELERECKESRESEGCEKLGSSISVDDEEGDEQEQENPEGGKEIREAAVEEMNFEKQEEEAETEQHHQNPVYGSQETETSADLEKLSDEENAPILIRQREEENLVETEAEIYGADNNVVDSNDAVDEIVEAISSSDEDQNTEEPQEQLVTPQRSEPEPECPETQEDEVGCQSKQETVKRESTVSVLPDCLPLMTCEPKLSMENKPDSTINKTDGGDDSKKWISIDSNPVPVQQSQQPSRSSCSHPSAAAYRACVTSSSMANMIEQKVVGGKVYEQFMLLRCKSEPRRSAAKLAVPETCFWKNRKLEPHRAAATLGVGAAGLGF
ncbi:uncharacterized protein LOC119987715 [Tripterygium wilfordii]|uniref:uncharacterized protein LOC119987715 n=1 Tax=Tripterygium wilfordii TaxID=458696 RepID=UPI0018F8637C|nr:uncharacterized protein LOC119987715 [Tripterygium wilfordii]